MSDGGTPASTPGAGPSGSARSGAAVGASRLSRLAWLQVLLGCLAAAAALVTIHAYCFGTAVTVQTEPPGATVFVNGRVAGATPVALSGLACGSYGLRFEKEGYVTLARPVQVTRDGLAVRETLTPNGTGSLAVQIKPRGAEVLLDGELIGHTPLQRSGIPVGVHELVVRKTNFRPCIQRIEVKPGPPLEFKDFGLEDIILAMLRSNVDKEKQCVRHYMDLGHYLFVNDELDEAAEVYAKALQVAVTPLEFPPEMKVEERALETRLRAEDANRLNEEIKRKTHWPTKDVLKFANILRQQQELVTGKNVTEWVTVYQMVQNYIQEQKYERAQALLLRHIAAVPNTPLLPQAYIELLRLRLRMHNLEGVRETYGKFFDAYGGRAELLRQAANGVYSAAQSYQGAERTEVLNMAERMLRTAVLLTKPGRGEPELHALCKFELANVLCLQSKPELAVPYYREGIAGTKHEGMKALRSQNLVECLKQMHNLAEARTVLTDLANNPDPEIAKKAKEDLRQLVPSPENK